ncbi:MAG TPA: ferritin-like domain-containing protein [Solirubrobacteraceae bacterium]|nr:ferritin-like domain-containing protein [Solirubrobacteraceae bacterium]
MTDSALRELADDPSSRKRFFKMLGGAGAVSAATVFLAACGDDDDESASSPKPAAEDGKADAKDNTSDLEILNYALTLEFLEAEFYRGVIDSGIVKDQKVVSLAKKFGSTEQEHVDALTATIEKLGGKPVAKPKTNFGPTLDKGLKAVLEAAADVENLGAAAYLGQAGSIKNKEVLAAALAIHSVEARHAAALNTLVGRGFGSGKGGLKGALPDGAFAKPMDMKAVLNAVQPFLA